MNKPSSTDELDLHGSTVAGAIEQFTRFYNARVDDDRHGCIKVIHGYGSSGEGGAIRIKLRAFLDDHLDKLPYEAGDQYGDPGWTFVYPKVHLPDERERMAAAILKLCVEGKTEEKILREFAKLGKVQIKQVVRSLTQRGGLKTTTKGAKVLYQATR